MYIISNVYWTVFQTGDDDTYYVNVSLEYIDSKCYCTDRDV